MSLENSINTPPGEYIRGGFSATIQMPLTRISKDGGKPFYVAKLADGAFRADVISWAKDFAPFNNQRVHFSGKGIKRGNDYNGTASITIGQETSCKSIGAGDAAAESHSEQTQAFPATVTRSAPKPYIPPANAPRVEGMAVGNALTNATSLAIAGKIQSEALESFLFHTASKYLSTAAKLLAGELSPSNILAEKEVATEEVPF
jgi:hypothetical protein